MRLIDADALMAEDFADSFIDSYDQAIFEAIIEKTPTIEAEPVKHGRWIEFKNPVIGRYFTCSICGKDENHHTAVVGKYCWNCGAKMDLEE